MNDNYTESVKDILKSYEQIKALYYDEDLSDEFKWQQVNIIAYRLYSYHNVSIETRDVKFFTEQECLRDYFTELTRYLFNKELEDLE